MTNEEKKAKRERIGETLLNSLNAAIENVRQYMADVGIPEENLTDISLTAHRRPDGTWQNEVEAYRYDREAEQSKYMFNTYQDTAEGGLTSHQFHTWMRPFMGEGEPDGREED